MADMLPVTTWQLGHPVPFLFLMKACHSSFQSFISSLT